VTRKSEPPPGSFAAAEWFQLRQALALTPAQRLQDLQDMIDFNEQAEARNPGLQKAVLALSRK
jgi:hypothetical protein